MLRYGGDACIVPLDAGSDLEPKLQSDNDDTRFDESYVAGSCVHINPAAFGKYRRIARSICGV